MFCVRSEWIVCLCNKVMNFCCILYIIEPQCIIVVTPCMIHHELLVVFYGCLSSCIYVVSCGSRYRFKLLEEVNE
jgi:hypothetical protein